MYSSQFSSIRGQSYRWALTYNASGPPDMPDALSQAGGATSIDEIDPWK